MRIRCSDRVGVIKGLGRGQPRGVTGREGFELEEEEEEEKDEEDIRLGNVLLSPLQSLRGKFFSLF